MRGLGVHVRRRVHQGVSQARRSRRRDSALQAERRRGIDEDVLHAAGGPMNRSYGIRGYHPRWLRRPMSTYWWLGKWCYFRFILREFSCMFVAWFVVYLLMTLDAVGQGPDRYARFMEWSASAPILATNVVRLSFHCLPRGDVLPGGAAGARRPRRQQARARTPGVNRSLCRVARGLGDRRLAARGLTEIAP